MTEDARSPDHHRRGRRHGLVSSAVMMLGSSYFDMLLGVVRGIIVMNLIGPTGRGIMRLVALFLKYLTHSHLGVVHGVSKQLPQALGREDHDAADDIERVGSTFILVTALAGGLGLLLFGMLSRYGSETRHALMIGGGLLVTQQGYALYRCLLRAWGRFPALAGAAMVNTLTQFVFIIIGAALFKVTGAMIGWLGAGVLTVLYFRLVSRFALRLRFERRVVRQLLIVGLPMALIVFSDTLLRTVDGIIVVGTYDAYRYGLYSVAMQVATYLYGIPEAVGFVIMPRILEMHAASNNNVESVRRQVLLPTIAAATVMPVAAGSAFILLPAAIHALIPQFAGATFAAQVLALASVLLALPVAANGLLIALNRELLVVGSKGLGAAVIYGLARRQALRDGSLAAIAQTAGLGYLVAGLLSLVAVLGRYYHSRAGLVFQIAMCYAPLAWCIAALRLSGWLVRPLELQTPDGWLPALVRLGVFLVAMMPVVLYGNARTGMFSAFGAVIRRAAAHLRPPDDGNHTEQD